MHAGTSLNIESVSIGNINFIRAKQASSLFDISPNIIYQIIVHRLQNLSFECDTANFPIAP